jgi:hypothetical protein
MPTSHPQQQTLHGAPRPPTLHIQQRQQPCNGKQKQRMVKLLRLLVVCGSLLLLLLLLLPEQ